jgi:hypothetical protein
MLVGLKWISTALGLLAALAAAAQAQNVAPSFNQLTANAVAEALRASQALSGYRIEIETQNGMATLAGAVATQAQKTEAIARAQRVAGVTGVIDRISVVGDHRVRPVQYQTALGFHRGGGVGGVGGDVIYDEAPASSPVYGPAAGGSDGPLPEGPAGMPGGGARSPLPNYAWPSYAPYPNFSAVGYPTAYPWQAWPNIGPPYPYPEVPLDWRAVTLRWDDGIWWLDFKKHYTRPFFTPYPFGIFAY